MALQTDEHIAKLTVQETMDFSAWVQGTELREGASAPLPSLMLLASKCSFGLYGEGLKSDWKLFKLRAITLLYHTVTLKEVKAGHRVSPICHGLTS